MKKQKSDTKRFFETMWIIAKYDVLPWMVGAGIAAAVIFGLQESKANENTLSKQAATLSLQKQR